LSRILDHLIESAFDSQIVKVLIGLHWIAVVADGQRCGLASTLYPGEHKHGHTDITQAGKLADLSGSDLVLMSRSDQPLTAGVGLAALNALLPQHPENWVDLNAEEVLAEHGAGKNVALIGHFPFVPRLRSRVGRLFVLEQSPQPGDLPADSAAEVLPRAEVIAITGTTLINHTLDELLRLCPPEALVILLGPSTPLSPLLFDHGLDILCGSVVESIDPVLDVVGQGGNFRQVHRAGVRTVTMIRSGLQLG
jgi:uncharacterized protein (DUF4213/DUF364 family)